MADDELICINVGGREFWTYYSTLERLPNTTLSQLARRRQAHEVYISSKNCFFYDRCPDAFKCVLEYYRSDELHISESVCGNAMKKELEFWGLSEAEIEPCCWGNYAKYHSYKETLADLESAFGGEDEYDFLEKAKNLKNAGSCLQRVKRKAWLSLEYPSESRVGKILMLISMGFVVLSILETILESHFTFRVVYDKGTRLTAPNPANYYDISTPYTTNCNCGNMQNTSTCSTTTESPELGEYPHTEPHPYLSTLDDICLGYFLLELIARLIFVPKKCQFFKGPLNIIDIVCVIPQLISIIIKHSHMAGNEILSSSASESFSHYEKAGDFLKAITVLRTVRILRVFKLMKHYSAFKILAYTIKVSTQELLLMVVYLMTGVLIFASVIHYAENKNFSSIPIGFWWALVTMTTVGYGDKHPKELVGYLVGSLCVMSGVLVIAFTVPIVVNNFSLYYTHAKTRIKLPKETVQEMRRNRTVRRNTILSSSKSQLVSRRSSLDTITESPNKVNAISLSSIDVSYQTNNNSHAAALPNLRESVSNSSPHIAESNLQQS